LFGFGSQSLSIGVSIGLRIGLRLDRSEQLFQAAEGSPGTAAGSGFSWLHAWLQLNNCSEKEALLPGRIGVLPGCQTCA